jgi:hypothetical protein
MFTKRVAAFEQPTQDSGGIANFLRISTGDLLRKIPSLEAEVISKLNGVREKPLEASHDALSRYMRTLRCLREALNASVRLAEDRAIARSLSN